MPISKERTIESYVLFKRLILLLTTHFNSQRRLVLTNIQVAISSEKEDKLAETLAVFNYVLLFVDLVIKIQKTAHAIPGISQRSPEFIEFNQNLGSLKEIRNRLQHINGEIMNTDSDNLLGSISWIDTPYVYMLSLLDISRNKQSTSIPFKVDELLLNKASCPRDMSYILNEDVYNLDSIYKACTDLCEFIDNKVILEDKDGVIDIRKRYSAIRLSIKPAKE